jgi:hypothetical protein
MIRKASPGARRFRQLVDRAIFDLKLADDVARAEGLDEGLTGPVEKARRALMDCLGELRVRQAAPAKSTRAEVGIVKAGRYCAAHPCRHGE